MITAPLDLNDQLRHSARARHMAVALIGLAGFVCWAGGANAAQSSSTEQQPTLNLFPTRLVDNIKATSKAAKQLENSLQGVIDKLDKEQKLYVKANCQGAMNDSGCEQVSHQMAQTYSHMLDVMGAELPKMKQTVDNTRDALQARLADQLGYTRTGSQLQQLLQNGAHAASALRTRPSGGGGMRLSDRFRQYYRLVSQVSQSGSLAVTGSQMYLDLDEASRLIALTQQQIQRSKIISNLAVSFGTLTPGMQKTVAVVKQVLFGKASANGGAANAAPAALKPERTSFCSEFDPSC
jgi:uncharacterized protein YukE